MQKSRKNAHLNFTIGTNEFCDYSIEITADGWKTDVTINGKTYSERHIGHYGSSECVEGNFEEDDEIPESIYDALNDFFCFGCQQALAQFEIEEGIEEE